MNWSMTSLVAMARGEVDACGITFCARGRGRAGQGRSASALQANRHGPSWMSCRGAAPGMG